MLDYRDLNDLLVQAGIETGAAECHGFLCGQICVSAMPDESSWKAFLDVRSDDADLLEDCYAELHTHATNIEFRFRSMDFGFQLLLPDEDSSMSERVSALSGWCQGFLTGFGLVPGHREMAPDCREVLEDLVMICRMGVENSAESGDEEALMHVVEYVRMGVLAIFEDLRYQALPGSAPGGVH